MTACRYWIGSDAKGHVCGQPAVKLAWCEKHFEVERARTLKAIDRRRAADDRRNAAWLARNAHRVPQWRVQLEQAEAEYARRTASPVADRAAVGGDVHGSIVQATARHLSDSNVARVIELERIMKTLRADIERAGEGTS